MKRTLLVFGSALFGVALCAVEFAALRSPAFGVVFPAPGGEDDFSLRAAAFLLGVCPAFLFLGGWIGVATSRGRWSWLAAWAGVVVGSGLTFVVVRMLRDVIASLTGSGEATRAVFAFFVAWVSAAALGAVIGGRSRR